MGEEYGETAPFYYFTNHGDPSIAAAVREGRKREFAEHGWKDELRDPQDPATFEESRVDLKRRHNEHNQEIFEHYRELIRMRKTHPALRSMDKTNMRIESIEDQSTLIMRRHEPDSEDLVLVFALGSKEACLRNLVEEGRWRKIYDSTLKHGVEDETSGNIELDASDSLIKFAPHSLTIYSKQSDS